MVEPSHPRLSLVHQCRLLGISRSAVAYKPTGESEQKLHLMRLIDEQFMETPFSGARQMSKLLIGMQY